MKKSNLEDVYDFGDGDGDGYGYDAVVVGSGYGGSVAACRMSMAGIKVCLIEKGRRWEARDFPTDSFKIWSAVRMENKNLGINFGPKDALFQVHIQDDSLAAMACGLGGGSLVNAGVTLPTPVRARRDIRWPKAWEKDWERCETLASEMLRVQTSPMKFQNAKIMEQVIDEDYDKSIHNPLKLSINFDIEEQLFDSKEIGSCLACGNCLSGCPYNAKISTDKTYLVSAIQAGCTIKTECEVQYVIKNEDHQNKEIEGRIKIRRNRRWLVFLNEFDYVAADFVILAAGVFGTTKILFQSQLRGLSLSHKLGSRLSCNGNNVSYLVRSLAPLNAFGLNIKQVSKTPFQERPGPSISSSFTSSLGFTIQSAVIPIAYPCFLFKGITTYRWKSGLWFLHNIIDKLKHITGLKLRQEMVLNAIGYDDSNGKLTFEKDANKVLFQPPHDPLLPKKIEAFEKLAKKLGGTLFMSRFRSNSAHLLGGCIVSSSVSSGVCNYNGQVFDNESSIGVHHGLYICDASIIPCSIGVNPCLTIAAAAEYVSVHLVKDVVKYNNDSMDDIIERKTINGKLEVLFKETMRGQIGNMPCTAYLKLKLNPNLRGKVGGYLVCKALEIDKLYVIHGEVDLCKIDTRTPYTQYMHYHCILASSSGSRYVLEGRKIMNPFFLALYAWRESTTLNVNLRKIITDSSVGKDTMNLKGMLNISSLEFLKSICSLEGATRTSFVFCFMQSLMRTYLLQIPRGGHISFMPMELARAPYPDSTIHEIKTEDGFVISCQHWECKQQTSTQEKDEKRRYPVLLLNGYSTESYCLPTEPNDLVRTLLKKGHDVWLLHSRTHPSHSSNEFSIEDIGKTDIPSAISMIVGLYGETVKVHVVAHCVGGLAIHIALLGGHVSSKRIASLCCTNSSMFFKLTAFSSFKMWLPLIPISMAILGNKKTIPLHSTSTTNLRHRILKSIARLLPRYERCTYNECEVFSGIFGNTYWHENITHTMHHWMNKVNLPHLPMSAFPHLRKICKAGYIVDAKGNNTYLIHPERMALPTLYISGGRTILVTQETSFLANKYMKMHQPCYMHERVVVEGFGHSDILIGEKSSEKVFPFIGKHIELAEKERGCLASEREGKYCKEALGWSSDLCDDDEGRFGSWVLNLITIILVVVMFNFYWLI